LLLHERDRVVERGGDRGSVLGSDLV